jgi:hypothetical protein
MRSTSCLVGRHFGGTRPVPEFFPVGISGPDREPRRLVEMIGGESAELRDGKVEDAEQIFAEWSERHTDVERKASGPHGAELELMAGARF